MHNETTQFIEVAEAEGLSVENLREAINNWKAASTNQTARDTTARSMLQIEQSITWPTEKWKDALLKTLGKKNGIITFIRNIWEPFIEKTGIVVTREIFAAHDPEAEQALTRYLVRHEMPKEISIFYPTQVMRILSERPELAAEVLRAHQTLSL